MDMLTTVQRATALGLMSPERLRHITIATFPWNLPDDIALKVEYLDGERAVVDARMSPDEVFDAGLFAQWRRGTRSVDVTPNKLVLADAEADNPHHEEELLTSNADFFNQLVFALAWLESELPPFRLVG